MSSRITNVLFYKKPYRILLEINNHLSRPEINKRLDFCLSNDYILIKDFKEEKLIELKERDKKTSEVFLTKKGELLKSYINEILKLLEETK